MQHHGRQDLGRASLRCFAPKTGEVHWTETGFGYATLIILLSVVPIFFLEGLANHRV